MASNDAILLDGILDDRLGPNPTPQERGEAFERFVFEQILSEYELGVDDISSRWVDGRQDGGIDGFFVLANGRLVDESWPSHDVRGPAEMDVWIISCKHHETFQLAVMDKLYATVSELLDFQKAAAGMRARYSDEIIQIRESFARAFRLLALRLSAITVNVCYASRGDTRTISAETIARGRQLQDEISGQFSKSTSRVSYYGAAELVELSRRRRRTEFSLAYERCLSQGERYVVLSRLADYAAFVLDENSRVRRHLYESNVRDFAGMNRVNADIRRSLDRTDGPDFWLLNNGITILVANAVITGTEVSMTDPQIVNGLQTTESIARYFADGGTDPAKRTLLVRIIKTVDIELRDSIIRATNNQTEVEQQSLHAMDSIQRNVEMILRREDWYYERRANYYSNLGMPRYRIVSPLYVAAAAVGVLLRDPIRARSLRQKSLRNHAEYRSIFSEQVPIAAWPRIVGLVRACDRVLSQIRARKDVNENDRFLKRWRHILGVLVLGRHFQTFAYSAKDVGSIPANHDFESDALAIWQFVESRGLGAVEGHKDFARCATLASSELGIANPEVFGPRNATGAPKTTAGQHIFTDVQRSAATDMLNPEGCSRGVLQSNLRSSLGVSKHDAHLLVDELMALKRIRFVEGRMFPGEVA